MAIRGTIVKGRRAPARLRGSALQVEGRAAVVANIYATQERVGNHLRRVNERAARQTRDLARQLAPKNTYNLQESLTYALSPGGLVFDVFHDPSFFPDEPYHVFQELGFTHHLSGDFVQNAHLFPAWESMRPVYHADVSRAARYAIEHRR